MRWIIKSMFFIERPRFLNYLFKTQSFEAVRYSECTVRFWMWVRPCQSVLPGHQLAWLENWYVTCKLSDLELACSTSIFLHLLPGELLAATDAYLGSDMYQSKSDARFVTNWFSCGFMLSGLDMFDPYSLAGVQATAPARSRRSAQMFTAYMFRVFTTSCRLFYPVGITICKSPRTVATLCRDTCQWAVMTLQVSWIM